MVLLWKLQYFALLNDLTSLLVLSDLHVLMEGYEQTKLLSLMGLMQHLIWASLLSLMGLMQHLIWASLSARVLVI